MDAMISGRGGLALVVDGDRLASIHAAEPETMVPRHRSEVHFLLGEARDFVAVENVSREEIVRQRRIATPGQGHLVQAPPAGSNLIAQRKGGAQAFNDTHHIIKMQQPAGLFAFIFR